MTDVEISKRLKADEKRVLKDLFDLYYEGLLRFAHKLTLNREIAEEITQDVFISLWERRKQATVSHYKSYLFQAVRFMAINYIKRNMLHFDTIDNYVQIPSAVHDNPLNALEGIELEAIIEKGLETLPRQCALIFTLSRNSGFTYNEIAMELNLSVKTVENQIGIAIKKLREFLSVNY